MSETRFSVRVDDTVKKQAEAVFDALGMNMSTGVNIFLARVARSQAIPFSLELDGDALESRMRDAVAAKVCAVTQADLPVALYDGEKNRPYLEYSGGRRVYDLD